jgi:hydrogenase maturation protease
VNRTLVVGIGNPLRGDDGLGIDIVERLRQVTPPLAADVVEGDVAGVGLVNLIEGYERVLIVDCARMGLPPGAHRVFHRDEVRGRRAGTGVGGHDDDPLLALDLAASLGRTPEVLFLAVEPLTLDGTFCLSGPVRRAIPAVMAEIRRLTEQGAWAHGSELGTHTHR